MSFPPKRLHGLRGFPIRFSKDFPCRCSVRAAAFSDMANSRRMAAWRCVASYGIHGVTENEFMVHIHLIWTICIYGNMPYFISMEIRKWPGNYIICIYDNSRNIPGSSLEYEWNIYIYISGISTVSEYKWEFILSMEIDGIWQNHHETGRCLWNFSRILAWFFQLELIFHSMGIWSDFWGFGLISH